MAEQRLIDANKLLQDMDGANEYATLCRWQILEAIDRQPTVDAVPVWYIRKWIESHPTDYTTVASMLMDWREEGDSDGI